MSTYSLAIDLTRNCNRAYETEQAALAKSGIAQMLIKSHMAAKGPRPIGQDLSVVAALTPISPTAAVRRRGESKVPFGCQNFRRVVCRRSGAGCNGAIPGLIGCSRLGILGQRHFR